MFTALSTREGSQTGACTCGIEQPAALRFIGGTRTVNRGLAERSFVCGFLMMLLCACTDNGVPTSAGFDGISAEIPSLADGADRTWEEGRSVDLPEVQSQPYREMSAQEVHQDSLSQDSPPSEIGDNSSPASDAGRAQDVGPVMDSTDSAPKCSSGAPWSLPKPCDQEAMPPCNYGNYEGYYPSPYVWVFQFERYDSSASLPSLPETVECDDELSLVLLRIRWEDVWADGIQGGVPCGGHCHETSTFVYILAAEDGQVLAAAKESYSAWNSLQPKPVLEPCQEGVLGCYCVKLEEFGIVLQTCDGWYPNMGLEPYLRGWVKVHVSGIEGPSKEIDLPLF